MHTIYRAVLHGRNILWRVVKPTPYGNMIIGMVCLRCPSAPMGSLFTLLPCIHPYHYDGLKRYMCGRSHKIPLPLTHITFNHFRMVISESISQRRSHSFGPQ